MEEHQPLCYFVNQQKPTLAFLRRSFKTIVGAQTFECLRKKQEALLFLISFQFI